MNEPNTLWIKGYSDDGFQVSVTLRIENVDDIGEIISQVRAQGIQPTPPAAPPATERMSIEAVNRRVWTGKDGKQKHALDFFADWAQWRVFTVYLDDDDSIRAFESASGKRITDLPVMNSGMAPEKNHADPNQISVNFDVLYKKETNSEGKTRDIFIDYASAEAPAPVTPSTVTPMPAQKATPKKASTPKPTTPAPQKPAKSVYEDRLPFPKDPRDATEFFSAARKLGLQPARVLKLLEPGKNLTGLSQTTLTREQAYERLAQINKEDLFSSPLAERLDNRPDTSETDQAPADSPLSGTIPAGFKADESEPIDIPF